MLKKIIIIALSLWVITAKAQLPPYVIPNIDWIKYNNPSSGIVSSAMAIDVNSNCYSTGFSGLTSSSNLIAFKYDSLGTMTYSYSYNNGNYDCGKAIKVDLAGNAYVAGVSYASTTLNDYYVIKLSPTGSVLWSKRLDNAHKDDEPYDICLDASGNAYVTGKSTNTSGNTDIWTVCLKYSDGSLLWQNTYAGASGLNDNGVGVVLSSNSSTVYVTGNTSDTHGSNIIIFALKASTGGTISGWPVITDGTAHSNDYSNGIIRCGANIVICGETNNSTTGADHTTIKYNGLTGAVMWTKKYDFLSATNRATALARDSADHIGVVGTALNGSTYEIHTILYDSLGNQLQVNKESTGLTALAADPRICNDTIAGHWYVVTSVMNASQDILVYQVTPTGNTAWKQAIDGQNYDYDLGTSIGVNGVGVVYVGAHSKNSSAQYDYTTIKINQTPYYFPPDLNGDSSDLGFQYWKNQGQLLNYTVGAVPQIKYYTMSQNPRTYLEPLQNHFVYTRGDVNQATNDTVIRVDMDFVNANTFSAFYPMQQTNGYMNFYLSHLPTAITGAKGSKRLIVPNIYPNVDLHYYSSKDGIKYYFVLKQGIANLRSIQIRFSGQQSDAILNRKLVNDCYLDTLKFSRPLCYQVNSSNTIITSGTGVWKSLGGSNYSIDSLTNMVSFWPVIIEVDVNKKSISSSPSTTGINWSTMFQNGTIEEIRASNKTGRQYVTGSTSDPNYPNVSGFQTYATSNFADAFITQFRPNNMIHWSTIYGGTASTYYRSADFGKGIDYDSLGYVYVGGYTFADSILTRASSNGSAYFQKKMKYPASGTSPNNSDAFMIKFDSTGRSSSNVNLPEWCTMLGGTDGEAINDIRYYNGYIYYVGSGGKKDFVTPAHSTPYQFKSGAYWQDTAIGYCSIYKFRNDLLYDWGTGFNRNPTVISGGSNFAINACDIYDLGGGFRMSNTTTTSNNGLVITGVSDNSGSLPRTSAGANLTPNCGGDDAFVSIFDSNDHLAFSTTLGSSGQDVGNDIVCLGSKAYVVGQASQGSSPTIKFPFKYGSGEYIDSLGSGGFISEFDVTDGKLKWSTLYGQDYVDGVCTDQSGKVFIHGSAYSSIFIPSSPPSGLYNQSASTFADTYVACINSRNFVWSTYFGGGGQDLASSISTYKNSDLYVCGAGSYASNTFPTFQTVGYYSTNGNMYVSRLGISALVNGIKENGKSDYLQSALVYPNPSTEYINISLPELKNNGKLDVYNALGQLVYSTAMQLPEAVINVGNFKAGLYVFKITDNEKSYSGKFIKQ